LFSDERKIPARLPDLQKGRLGLGQEEKMRYNNQNEISNGEILYYTIDYSADKLFLIYACHLILLTLLNVSDV
jgi:hypothetical protein